MPVKRLAVARRLRYVGNYYALHPTAFPSSLSLKSPKPRMMRGETSEYITSFGCKWREKQRRVCSSWRYKEKIRNERKPGEEEENRTSRDAGSHDLYISVLHRKLIWSNNRTGELRDSCGSLFVYLVWCRDINRSNKTTLELIFFTYIYKYLHFTQVWIRLDRRRRRRLASPTSFSFYSCGK